MNRNAGPSAAGPPPAGPPPAGPGRADGGFTLMEAIVGLFVFAVFSTVALAVIVNAMSSARALGIRTVAANLVTRQIESVRTMSAPAIPDGLTTYTRTVGAVTYTIRQTATYVSLGAAGSACNGTGSSLANKLVTVTASWPGMGTLRSPKAQTLVSVDIGTNGLDQTSAGALALSVLDATGAPTPDVPVTLAPGGWTRTAGDDGCVVFAELPVGTYAVSTAVTGYVGVANTRAVTVNSLGVTAGNITRGSLMYDRARSVQVLLDAPPGAYVPPTLPLRIGDRYVPETTVPVCVAGSTSACTSASPVGTISSLFPENDTVKVGTCAESSPSAVTIDLRPTPSATPSVTVPVGAVTVRVNNLLGVAQAGRTVAATHTAGCSESYTLPSTAAAGSVLVLPYGTWSLTTPTGLLAVQVTVGPSNRTPAVTLTSTT